MERTVKRGEAECERQRANSAGYRKLDGEIRLTRGDVPPGDGLLLDWSTICRAVVDRHNVAFGPGEQSIACGAVVA